LIVRGGITGPISETVAFSLAGNLNKRDGYVRDEALGVDFNDRDRWGVRGSLLFKPSDDFKIRLIADYDAIDEVCCAVVNIVDGPTGNAVRALGGRIESNSPFALRQFTNYASVNDIKNYGLSLQSDARIGAFDLTTILAYRAVDSLTDQDSDFTSADLIGSNFNDTKIDTYTAEVRLASNFDGMFNFLVGGFYFHEDIGIDSGLTFGRDFRNYASLLSGGAYTSLEPTLRALLPGTPAGAFGAQGQGRFEDFNYRNRALSIFGQADFAITDRLTVTAGGNYTNDRKNVASNNTTTDVFSGLDLVLAGVRAGVPATVAANPAANPFLGLRALQFLPPFLNFPNAVEDGRTRDNNFSYTLRVAYKFSEEISAYATYATGFKASSFNLSTDSRPFPSQFIPGSPAQVPGPAASPIRTAGLAVTNLVTGTRFAGPEEAEVYEVGVKGSFTGFRFNFAGFYQVLRGFQGNVFSGTGFVLANAPQASVQGIELDAVFTPVRDFSVSTNFTYLDARNDDFPGGSALVNGSFQVVPTDLSGQRFAGTPEFAMSIAADYTARLGNDTRALFHVDFFHESPVQIAQGTVPLRREAYSLNASATLAFKQGFEVSVWGRNLTDATYLTTIFPGVAQAGTLSGYRNQPRTYGVLARYRF
jgi:outer membrane receptor protein involved in Fe transport